jgi:hypothetical protein
MSKNNRGIGREKAQKAQNQESALAFFGRVGSSQ